MWTSGTLAQNGVFYRAIYPWQGWGGISPEFDDILTGTFLCLSAVAQDGVLHQGLEYDQPYSFESSWGIAPFAPRKEARKPTRAHVQQVDWELKRLERQLEKERLAEIEWAAEGERQAEIRAAAERARQVEQEREWAAEEARIARIEARAAKWRAKHKQSEDELRRRWAKWRAKNDAVVTRQEVEHSLGLSIAQAKAEFEPGPLKPNGEPDMSRWRYGVHAHPSLWLWED